MTFTALRAVGGDGHIRKVCSHRYQPRKPCKRLFYLIFTALRAVGSDGHIHEVCSHRHPPHKPCKRLFYLIFGGAADF